MIKLNIDCKISIQVNCLVYALRFWNENREYKIYYDGDHVVNLRWYNPSHPYLLPLSFYGIEYFLSAFKEHLSDEDIKLLKEYFEHLKPE